MASPPKPSVLGRRPIETEQYQLKAWFFSALSSATWTVFLTTALVTFVLNLNVIFNDFNDFWSPSQNLSMVGINRSNIQ